MFVGSFTLQNLYRNPYVDFSNGLSVSTFAIYNAQSFANIIDYLGNHISLFYYSEIWWTRLSPGSDFNRTDLIDSKMC